MPALHFSTDPCRLLDCLGLATRSPEGNDPFLSLRGETLGKPEPLGTEAEAGCYARRYAGGLRAETRFRELRSGVWERQDTLRNEGESELVLTDVVALCANARFCDRAGGAWDIGFQAARAALAAIKVEY